MFDIEFNILIISFAFGFLSFVCTQHNDPVDMTGLPTFYSAKAVDIWAFASLNTEKDLLPSFVYQSIESMYDTCLISDNICI